MSRNTEKPATPCVEHPGCICKTLGYGVMYNPENQRLKYAHRDAWIKAHGPIPKGMFVCHRCDNRACVRLDHLFLGTHRDNMMDMRAKKRGAAPFMSADDKTWITFAAELTDSDDGAFSGEGD